RSAAGIAGLHRTDAHPAFRARCPVARRSLHRESRRRNADPRGDAMNKMFAVFKREYLQAVRKKSFIIMTFLLPFLMIGVMMLPALMLERGIGEKQLAVLDGTGKLRQAFARPNEREKRDPKKDAQDALSGQRRPPQLPAQLRVEYVDMSGKDLDTAAKPYLDRISRGKDAADKLEGVFVVPTDAISNDQSKMTYY